jgi:hypothetical protein
MAQDKKEDDHEQDEEPEEENSYEKERKDDYLDFRRKMDEFKGAQEGMVSESEALKSQGNAYFSFGCYSQATIMYSDAIELQPHSHVLYCNRAMAYLKQEMADLALADAIKSLEIESSVDNIKAYWRKSQALLDLDRYEEAEAAAGEGLALHGRNPHLNKVRRKAREASVTQRLVAGDWVGKLDNGIEQRLTFSREGEMSMTVFGHSLISTFELSVEGNPRSMVVRMKYEAGPGSPPPPPMVYIFDFQDDDKELWLCHPTDGSKDLPTKFEGSGLVKHRRVEAAKPKAEEVSDEPLDERCLRYMREMVAVLPLNPPQLPEKPSDEQIRDEVEICGRVSTLKRNYGLEVHRHAVELAKAPSSAANVEMEELAQKLRRRFLARKLLAEDPNAKAPKPEPAPQVAPSPPPVVDGAEVTTAKVEAVVPAVPEPSANSAEFEKLVHTKIDSRGQDMLSRLASCICGGCGKVS